MVTQYSTLTANSFRSWFLHWLLYSSQITQLSLTFSLLISISRPCYLSLSEIFQPSLRFGSHSSFLNNSLSLLWFAQVLSQLQPLYIAVTTTCNCVSRHFHQFCLTLYFPHSHSNSHSLSHVMHVLTRNLSLEKATSTMVNNVTSRIAHSIRR